MKKYLLEIQYKGTNYHGWQAQKNTKTVQGIIEEHLQTVARQSIRIFAAGRTDAGVHAKQQFAHFETEQNLERNKLRYSLNSLMKNEDILITNLTEIELDFHARFSCIEKTYRYYFLVGRFQDVFYKELCYLVPTFDLDKANECAQQLIGEHDFQSFRDVDCQSKLSTKTIKSFEFFQENQYIVMEVKAQSFLHHQIRIMAGTIFEIIAKEKEPEEIQKILAAKNRQAAGPTAPASGLFLEKVSY